MWLTIHVLYTLCVLNPDQTARSRMHPIKVFAQAYTRKDIQTGVLLYWPVILSLSSSEDALPFMNDYLDILISNFIKFLS